MTTCLRLNSAINHPLLLISLDIYSDISDTPYSSVLNRNLKRPHSNSLFLKSIPKFATNSKCQNLHFKNREVLRTVDQRAI